MHLETTRQAAAAGKHVFLDKPIANSVSDGRKITEACRQAGVVLALGYQRRRESHFRWIKQQIEAGVFGKMVNAEANISRDRLGQFDLTSWRYTAAGMPGGVMLQIGVHYADVLDYLLGPIKAVSGQFAQLVLPGDNPDVASLVFEHENGALSTLNASYASASEYYLMNIYGKAATAYYDLHHGLSWLKQGEKKPVAVPCDKNDTFVEELEEFAAAARGGPPPEVGGDYATKSLAVIRAGIALGARRPPRRSRGDPGERLSAASSAAIAACRIGCHLAMSVLSTAQDAPGPRSALAGIAPPRSIRRLATAGSSSALSSAAASLATTSFGAPFGAYIALQMLS